MGPKKLSNSSYFSTPANKDAHLTVRCSNDLVQRLAVAGNTEGLSLSETIRVMLERGLDITDQHKEQIREHRHRSPFPSAQDRAPRGTSFPQHE